MYMRQAFCLMLLLLFAFIFVGQKTVEAEAENNIERYFGQDRYETAVAISQEGWEEAHKVVIARGDNFPDALSGVPLAHHYQAPMLLSRYGEIHESTVEEIERLGAQEAVILGGEAAVSVEVELELEEMGLETERIGGENRYHTSALIADELGEVEEAFLVKGTDFKDALVVSPYAAREGHPIVLTRQDQAVEEVHPVLQRAEKVTAVGDVEEAIEALGIEAVHINNPDHYSNAIEFVEKHPDAAAPQEVIVATGEEYPDALTGGVLAAQKNAGIKLVGDTVPAEFEEWMSKKELEGVGLLGGPAAVREDIENKLRTDIDVGIEIEIEPDLEPEVSLQVENNTYEKDEEIEFKIENTGETPLTFEREFTVSYMVAVEDDQDAEFVDEERKVYPGDVLERDGAGPIITHIREICKSVFTQAVGLLEGEGFSDEEEDSDDGLMRIGRRDTEDKLASGDTPGERLNIGSITGAQKEDNTGWITVELDRAWPEQPVTLEPGESETQAFVPASDFVDEPRKATYSVAQKFKCDETGIANEFSDVFYLDVGTDFSAELEVKGEEFDPAEEVEFEVINNGRTDIEFARTFGVLRYEDGRWVNVELDMEFLHDMVGLSPGETFQQGFIPEEDFANTDDVVEGRYIAVKLVRCRETSSSKVVSDGFALSFEEEEGHFSPGIEAPEEVESGEEFIVTFAVNNTGDGEDTQEVYMRKIVDEEIGVKWSEEVTLEPGETWADRETYTAEADESYRFELETDDAEATEHVRVVSEAEAEFIPRINAPEEVNAGEEFIVTFAVENMGDGEATQEVYMRKIVDEEIGVKWSEEVTLEPGETWADRETYTAEAEESYRFELETDDAEATEYVRVVSEAEAEFIPRINAPEEVNAGEEFEINMAVKNAGEAEGTQMVTFTMYVNGEEESRTETITLEPGETTYRSESFIADTEVDGYRFQLETSDESDTATVIVRHHELH